MSMKLRKDKINMSDPLKQQQKPCMYSISKLYQYLWIKIYLSRILYFKYSKSSIYVEDIKINIFIIFLSI